MEPLSSPVVVEAGVSDADDKAAPAAAEPPVPPVGPGTPLLHREMPRLPGKPLPRSKLVCGALIVAAGLGWGGFQLWPRGSVERSIVQALAAQPRFEERVGPDNPFAAVLVDGDSSPAFADLNGDGARDLVLGSRSGEIRVYLNAGRDRRARFPRPAAQTFGFAPTDATNTLVFADLRGVNLLDAVDAGASGMPTCFENRGTPLRADFVLLPPDEAPIAVEPNSARSFDWRPAFADVDGDGDADLFVGTRDGTLLFFENRGNRTKPNFRGAARSNPFGLHDAGRLIAPAFGDLDGDGDLDALVANAAGAIRFFENRGTATRPKFLLMPPGALGLTGGVPEATVALFDADADGDLDVVAGGFDGRLRFLENLRAAAPAGR